MIDEMYNVMQRIAELSERFGLKRHNVEAPAGNFKNELDNYIESMGSAKDPSEYTKEDINKIAAYYARKNDIPPALVKSMISVESSYNPLAVSPKGAMGLMQLMPVIVGEMKVDDPFSPEQNIRAGAGHFRRLLNHYNNDLPKSLAAYNAGMGAVDRAGGVPNFRETKNYIDRVVSTYLENSKR
jgi:soluble lytic murein transglycosylase-like protein